MLRANIKADAACCASLGIDHSKITPDCNGVIGTDAFAPFAADTSHVAKFSNGLSGFMGTAQHLNRAALRDEIDNAPRAFINAQTAAHTFLNIDDSEPILDGNGTKRANLLATSQSKTSVRAGLGASTDIHSGPAIVDALVNKPLACMFLSPLAGDYGNLPLGLFYLFA